MEFIAKAFRSMTIFAKVATASAIGTGKIYHGSQNGLFDEYGVNGDVGPWPWDGQSENFRLPHPQQLFLYEGDDADMDYKWEHVFGPLSDIPVWPADPAKGIPGYTGWRLFGKPWRYADDDDRDPLADELGAKWSAEVIQRNHDKPFALFTGLIRTHTPLYAPKATSIAFPCIPSNCRRSSPMIWMMSPGH